MVRRKVVIADDSAIARQLLKQALSGLNVEVVEATTGNETIRALNEHKPDLLVLDVSMPFPDGLTVLRRMRADPEFRDTTVVIYSVEDGPDIRTAAEQFHVAAKLTKPVMQQAMRNVLTGLLSDLHN